MIKLKKNSVINPGIIPALIICTFISLSLTSCKEYDEENKPAFSLSAPANGQTYQPGDTIFILGDLSDNNTLHQLTIKLINKSTGQAVIDESPTVHAMKSYHIDYFYVPSGTTPIQFELEMEAHDHNLNTTSVKHTLHWGV